MSTLTTAEKIETIVQCYLTDRTTSGAFGTLVDVSEACETPNLYRVEADGKQVIARCCVDGWAVSFCGFIGRGDIYEAARDALAGGSGRNVSSVADAFAILS
jgi:hypothetical protein